MARGNFNVCFKLLKFEATKNFFFINNIAASPCAVLYAALDTAPRGIPSWDAGYTAPAALLSAPGGSAFAALRGTADAALSPAPPLAPRCRSPADTCGTAGACTGSRSPAPRRFPRGAPCTFSRRLSCILSRSPPCTFLHS